MEVQKKIKGIEKDWSDRKNMQSTFLSTTMNISTIINLLWFHKSCYKSLITDIACDPVCDIVNEWFIRGKYVREVVGYHKVNLEHIEETATHWAVQSLNFHQVEIVYHCRMLFWRNTVIDHWRHGLLKVG